MNEVCDSALVAEEVVASPSEARAIPLVVYCLTLGVFALTTSELMISE
jgi:DHA1 family inner membrane transport protein